jgi:16S rRNA (guanine527-N7)-methyltransferase
MMDISSFQSDVEDFLGLSLNSNQLDAFSWYCDELIAWNQRMNLTAITDPEEIAPKHFLDSLSCMLAQDFKPGGSAVDVGTGAGFPGLPLKIVFPQFRLVLVESIGKKVTFCRHVIEQLKLSEIDVVHTRAEQIGQDDGFRESFDWAFARAVSSTAVLLEYILPLLKVGGKAIIQKGEAGLVELQESTQALDVLGGEVIQILPLELPRIVETRYLLVVEKIAATPARYPRRAGIPSKRPIR